MTFMKNTDNIYKRVIKMNYIEYYNKYNQKNNNNKDGHKDQLKYPKRKHINTC